MMRPCISRFLIAAGLLCSAAVFAQQAWTTRQVNVRAGPDREYPLVATLDAGTQVEVVGCVEDYRWCDIFHGEIRGWVYAKGLQYAYESRRVPIYGYGAIVGLPIVTFSILSYWDNYYTNRPFYRDRPRWEHRPYPGGPGWVPSPREPRYFPPRQREPQVRRSTPATRSIVQRVRWSRSIVRRVRSSRSTARRVRSNHKSGRSDPRTRRFVRPASSGRRCNRLRALPPASRAAVPRPAGKGPSSAVRRTPGANARTSFRRTAPSAAGPADDRRYDAIRPSSPRARACLP
ncbi:MAG: SH3 domain-containing protein [Betaproteobacteria bacterium]|nr:SH3 domain-containing protein [Betaproteobacteria bacterium]